MFGFILGGNASVYAADGEVYDLNTKNIKYSLGNLTSLKIQMQVGLHSSQYGYEYGSQVYNLNDVNKTYANEVKSGNKNLTSILGKVKSNCKPAFIANDFSVKNVEYLDEIFSSNLYVEVSNPGKVIGVTVDGVSLELDDRYTIEDNKVKITFKKGTPIDKIGNVLIITSSKSYEVILQDNVDFDVIDIY